jgi:enoyl-CoA hydratase
MNIEDRKYETIRFSRRGRVLTASLNRPEAGNAVNGLMHTELSRLFYDLQDDAQSDVLVLAGEGRHFCAGGDIGWMQDSIDDPDVFLAMGQEAKRIIFGQVELEKPLICRLNGAAAGLGASLALLCDVIIAGDNASLSDPHVSVGLVAGDGGCILWPQLVGYARAREYLFTGKMCAAAEAERIGLINRVVPLAELDRAVNDFADELANGATRAIRWTKVTVNTPLKALVHQIFDVGLAYETLSNGTKDHQEAVTAFRERRKPKFSGR